MSSLFVKKGDKAIFGFLRDFQQGQGIRAEEVVKFLQQLHLEKM
jgi:hypothetical protein